MTTLKDVAKRAGLSVTQTSRALNDHSDVSTATRERVKQIAQTLQYRPNLSARKLVSGRSGLVGLVVPRNSNLISDNLFIEVVSGLSSAFTKRDMQLVLHVTQEDEPVIPVYKRLIANGALDGFVLIYPQDTDPRADFLSKAKLPFVVHGRIGPAPRHAYFDIDNEKIFYQITRHLTALGHRRIALLNGEDRHAYATARSRGYLRAISDSRIDPAMAIIRNDFMNEAFGLVATVGLFSSVENRPTAIICGSVRIAKGVYQALHALGLAIPRDVSVFAHDDHIAQIKTESFYPALSVTDAPMRDSWSPLADCLEGAISGAPLAELQLVGPHRIILRQSTAAPCQ